MAAQASRAPTAIEQALALFEPDWRPSDTRLTDGYLDLLGDEDPIGSERGQRVAHSRLLPLIYGWLWRPIVLRVWAGLRAPGRREERRIVMRMLELTPGDRLLDVGCGPGNFTRRFAQATGDGLVVGLDASRAMLAAAARRSREGNTVYMRADGAALPFRASSYQAVCCFGALHLFEQPVTALDEIVRVLAPGGRVALLTTCGAQSESDSGGSATRKSGMLVFGRDEITVALGERGLIDIDQRIMRMAQFVSARKLAA